MAITDIDRAPQLIQDMADFIGRFGVGMMKTKRMAPTKLYGGHAVKNLGGLRKIWPRHRRLSGGYILREA